jgi:hypothetical protein
LREEADGGRALIGVVEEGVDERGMLLRLDEGRAWSISKETTRNSRVKIAIFRI